MAQPQRKIDKTLSLRYPENWIESKDLNKEIAEKIYYLSPAIETCLFDKDRIVLGLSRTVDDQGKLEADILDLLTKMAASFQKTAHDVLESYQGSILVSDEDPYDTLERTGQVTMSLPGVPVFRGEIVKVLEGLDRFLKNYAFSLGAVEEKYPTTLATDSLLRSGYLKGFPQHALLVGAIHHDMESLRAIANNPDQYKTGEDVDPLISNHSQVLAPTVCGHCFEALKDKPLDRQSQLVTAVAHCHRHEGKNHNKLDRLQTYTMREIIFFGSPDTVRGYQEKILEDLKKAFTQWDISWRVLVASDPFFVTGSEQKKIFQTAFRLKYELQVYLPHSDQWIAAASFNHHQDGLVKSYGLKPAVGNEQEPLQSGCFGLGFERLIYALYSQKGTDIAAWPQALKQDLSL